MKKYLGLIICGLLLLTGCNKVPKLENGQEVIVEIDGKQFTAEELYEQLKKDNGVTALVGLVDKYITDQELTDEMKKEAKDSAQTEYEQTKAYYSTQWADFLAYYKFDNDQDLIDALYDSYTQKLVIEKYIREEVITEKDIEKYYKDEIYGEITARHILVIPEKKSTDEEQKAADEVALNKINGFIETLKSSTDLENDFIKLAKENSEDTGSASQGGLISNFTNQSGLAKEFWEESLKLKVGKFSTTPIKTEFGYHIIYKVSQNDKPSLEDVRDTIIKSLVKELTEATNANYIYWSGLREKYNMTIHDDTIKSSYKATLNDL